MSELSDGVYQSEGFRSDLANWARAWAPSSSVMTIPVPHGE